MTLRMLEDPFPLWQPNEHLLLRLLGVNGIYPYYKVTDDSSEQAQLTDVIIYVANSDDLTQEQERALIAWGRDRFGITDVTIEDNTPAEPLEEPATESTE